MSSTGVQPACDFAIAHAGGLIAAALAAVVFAAHGPALLSAFRIAVLATAATALAAGAAIWLLGTDLKPADPALARGVQAEHG